MPFIFTLMEVGMCTQDQFPALSPPPHDFFWLGDYFAARTLPDSMRSHVKFNIYILNQRANQKKRRTKDNRFLGRRGKNPR